MFKNKIFFIVFIGIVQSAYPMKPQRINKKKDAITTSWTRSPFVWGTVALAGTLGAWVYKKYQDYLKENKEPNLLRQKENSKEISEDYWENVEGQIRYRETEDDKKDLYVFIVDKYDYFLQNSALDKNFFEKTTTEQDFLK